VANIEKRCCNHFEAEIKPGIVRFNQPNNTSHPIQGREVLERWRKTASLAIVFLVLSVPLPWLTVTLNLSPIERGIQQYSLLGVETKALLPTVSNSVFVSTPYFDRLFDIPYFALSMLLLLLALVSSAISILLRKSRLQILAAGSALTAAWYWIDDVKRLDEYLYIHNYLSSGMCYIELKWVRCVSAEVGIGTYLAAIAGLIFLTGWLIDTPITSRRIARPNSRDELPSHSP
jgi:hypothetical protein